MKHLLFLLIISAFFGPYLYLFDDRVHLIRVISLFVIVAGFIYRAKLNNDALVILAYFSIYFFYTLVISIIDDFISKIAGNDIINLIVLYLFVFALIISISTDVKVYLRVFRVAIVLFLLASLIVGVRIDNA